MPDLSDLTAQCIRCGFCLESCPTFQISGDESESPRGRIYIVRSLEEGAITWSKDTASAMGTCVGCRACETACPSGVQYGKILEHARALYGREPGVKWLLGFMTRPGLLRPALRMARGLGVNTLPPFLSLSSGTRLPVAERRADYPPLHERELPPVAGEVAVLRGCVMDVLYSNVHQATERLLRRVGFRVRWVRGCCGALHAHNGFEDEGNRRAKRVLENMGILLTNAAGCGSHLAETGGAECRVCDVTTFLFEQGLAESLNRSKGMAGIIVAYQEACHLAHGLKERSAPRELLRSVPGLAFVDLPELCCGSGGVYNLLQPERARKLLLLKVAQIEASGAHVVATGNPGCHSWISQGLANSRGTVQVFHTLTLLEQSFSGSPR